MDAVRDPIAELVSALACDGKPTLAWAIRWSADGRDPVTAAWDATEDADAMQALLARIRPADLERAIALVERTLGPGWYHRTAREIAPTFKRAVTSPPTLREVMR